jgi:N-methylhydantoinase B
MNNLTIGGWDTIRNRPFAYYETIAGGAGASAAGDGASAVHTHMTNTRNTPVEALEAHYPLRVQEYSIRTDCVPNGLHSGGSGIVRRIELLCDCQVSLLSERRLTAPWGVGGGTEGKTGSATWTESEGTPEKLPGKFSRYGKQGTTLEIQTPCGGGWGKRSFFEQSAKASETGFLSITYIPQISDTTR